MRTNFSRQASAWLQPLMVAALLFAGAISFSFSMQKKYDDLWQQLGITQRDGTNYIRSSFATGYLQFGTKATFKNILAPDRKTIALDLLNYTKQTIASQEFKTEYERTRMSRKPRREPKPPKTEQQIREEEITNASKGIANGEETLKNTTDAESRKAIQESIDFMKKSLTELKDPNNETVKYKAQSQKTFYENQLAKFQADLKVWETEYPENVNTLIKQRLQKMLDETKDVDYEAQLVDKNGKKYFVKPAYEAKPVNWKFAFRAGKDVTDATRAFASDWLKQL